MALLLKKPKEELNTAFKNLFPTYYSQISRKHQPGIIMILALVFMLVVLVLSAPLFTKTGSFVNFTGKSIDREKAASIAEAGIDYAIWQINQDSDYFLNQGGFEIVTFGQGEFHVKEISPPPANGNKKIVVTGYIPSYTTPLAQKVTGQLEINQGGSIFDASFLYAAHADQDDLNMDRRSEIDGPANQVLAYSNSNITCEASCQADVFGDASAAGTIDNNIDVSGTETEGAPPVLLPSIDVDHWKNEAELGGINNGTLFLNESNEEYCVEDTATCTIGPLKIDGRLRWEDEVTIIVTGPLWITQDFEMEDNQAGIIRPADSLGSEGAVIIVDNGFYISAQSSEVRANNANPKGFLLFYSTTVGNTCSIHLPNQTSNDHTLLALAPDSNICYTGGGDPSGVNYRGALAANRINMNTGASRSYIEYDPDANFPRFDSIGGSSTSDWQIVRGTYQFTK